MKRFGSFHLRDMQDFLSEESGSRHVSVTFIHAAFTHKAYVQEVIRITLLRDIPATV